MNNHTAKHFVLQLGSLISLYLSLAFFLVLSFGFINLLFPDALDSVWQMESAASSVRIGFAMVVVFFPTYLVLTRMVNQNRRQSKDNAYLGLTKWLIYLSLLVGGLVLLGDLVAIIIGFLEGELTMRFILKALVVFVITGAAFFYYIKDAQGYWLGKERQSMLYALVATAVIAVTIIAAVVHIPNPAVVREMNIDQQMVNDLQDIRWRIEEYYLQNETLPADLATLYGAFTVPAAPEGRPNYLYSYEELTSTDYQLCATFSYDSTYFGNTYVNSSYATDMNNSSNYNWDFKAGEWCFDRSIDKQRL